MAMTTTVRHHSSVDLPHACTVEASVVTTRHATELHLRLAPVASAMSRNACHIQTRVLYDALDEVLHGLSAQTDHVLIEKAYFRDLACDHEEFDQIRYEYYRKRGLLNGGMPAITYLGQPPCRPGIDIELQVFAVIPTSPEAVNVVTCPSPLPGISVKLVEVGSARHLFVNNLTGLAVVGQPSGFRQQIDRVFRTVGDILEEQNASFSDVLRTWFYLPDIEADYAELNSARNAFFSAEKVTRPPASSAIGAFAQTPATRCALDVYALLNPEVAKIDIMQTPTLNDASESGAAFSRGIRLALSEATYLLISGTPGLDEIGRSVHKNDIGAQIERMLANVESLLSEQGATWGDLTHAVTYLRSPEYLELYEDVCAERGIRDVPHSIVCANLCRPDIVCEMEAVAVIGSA